MIHLLPAAGLFLAAMLYPDELALTQETIVITGSSTLAPFSHEVAERLTRGKDVDFVLNQTGTSGGFEIFCSAGNDVDIVNASRPVKPEEVERCRQLGRYPLIEFPAGKDGIILAQASGNRDLPLTLKQIYLALAQYTPISDQDCSLEPNTRKTWDDVSDDLPKRPIEIFGPPDTSGTRDSFMELVMHAGAMEVECLAAAREQGDGSLLGEAIRLREDGAWVDAGENDDAVVAALVQVTSALGVFGYSQVLSHGHVISAVTIDGIAVGPETIADGSYPLSRGMWFYIDAETYARSIILQEYAAEFISGEALGPGGYLAKTGLVPFGKDAAENIRYRFVTGADDSEQAQPLEGDMLAAPDDKVVVDPDADSPGGLDNAVGHVDIRP
ncbi:phosphate ABC transporter substrate-binding protein [Aquisalinus flavus]|nr:phosphate ABC transporter substrate-binding protein [Aquisalinus flavus]